MERDMRDNDQFTRLHNQFMPVLYRAAFYLLGDSDAARGACAQAWLAAYRDDGCRADDRVFAARAEQMLVALCAPLAAVFADSYAVTTADGMAQPLLRLLATLRFNDRALLVLAAVCGRSPREISAILAQPRLLVEFRLAEVMKEAGLTADTGEQVTDHFRKKAWLRT